MGVNKQYSVIQCKQKAESKIENKPPQKWPPFFCKDTCHGMGASASSPKILFKK